MSENRLSSGIARRSVVLFPQAPIGLVNHTRSGMTRTACPAAHEDWLKYYLFRTAVRSECHLESVPRTPLMAIPSEARRAWPLRILGRGSRLTRRIRRSDSGHRQQFDQGGGQAPGL